MNTGSTALSRLAVQQGVLELYGFGNTLDLHTLEIHGGAEFRAAPFPVLSGPLNHDNKRLLITHQGRSTPAATYRVGSDGMQTLSARDAQLGFRADTLTGFALLDVQGSADITGSTVDYLLAVPGQQTLTAGAEQILMETSGTLTSSQIQAGTLQARVGSTIMHDFELLSQGNRLVARLGTAGRASQASKALSEGALGGVATVGAGAELITDQGMAAAKQATSGNRQATGFAAVSAGKYRDNTGSHVDTKGVSTMLGLARGLSTPAGDLTAGVFAEYGHGAYDTYNNFSALAPVHGSGRADYAGGGLMARLDLGDAEQDHAFIEASARAGRLSNDYRSKDLTDPLGHAASYDISMPYYGAHLGLGYAWRPSPRLKLELHNRYIWTHVQGSSSTLSTGEQLDFSAVDSQRNRLGLRLGYDVDQHVSPYVGLAWEHEFDGRMKATTNGYRIDAPSLAGNTGIAELGLRVSPSSNSRLSADLSLQAYAGRREGATGALRVHYEF